MTGKNHRAEQTPHFTRGFSQTPRTHSLAHAGEYPDFLDARLSNRTGNTSALPRNNDRNSAILSSGGETRETGCGVETGEVCMVVQTGRLNAVMQGHEISAGAIVSASEWNFLKRASMAVTLAMRSSSRPRKRM